MVICIFFGLAGGWALDKYGPKVVFFLMGLFTGLSFVLTSFAGSLFHIYFTYSFLFAVGAAPFFAVINATISKWFDKKRGIALGIATSGSRSGQAVFAPLSAFLIASFGWRHAYLITGVIAWLVIIPLSRLMKNGPQDVGALPDGIEDNTGTSRKDNKIKAPEAEGLTFSQALKDRNYWYIVPTWLFAGVATMLVYTHIIPFAVDMNISTMSASTILTIIGAIAIPSGILAGKLIDTTGPKIPLMVFTLVYAGAISSFIWARELWNLYLIAAIIGVCNAGLGITIVAATVDAFGKRRMGMIIASLDACHSIGAVIGPLIGGLVFDTYGSYSLAFLMATTGLVFAGLMLVFFKTKTAARVYG